MATENTNEPKLSHEQYDMLKRCMRKKDMSEWNQWRKDNPGVEIWLDGISPREGSFLEGAELHHANLRGANFYGSKLRAAKFYSAKMQDAVFDGANLEQADFSFGDTNLEGAKFMSSNLRGADLTGANLQRCNFIKADMAGATLESSDLQGAIFCEANLKKVDISCANLKSAKFELAKVDADTVLQFCDFDKYTDFTGVGLDAARIQPGLKVALKNNIRRMHWKIWLRKGNIFFRILKNLFVRPFWWMTGYGSSTVSILFWFVGLVFGFAGLYFWFEITGNKVVDGLTVCGMPWYHTCLRAIYFSVVTMTTLGFGDLYALDESYWGHVLLMLQVILGYLLLGALVTRLGILFTNEAPAAGPRSYDSN